MYIIEKGRDLFFFSELESNWKVKILRLLKESVEKVLYIGIYKNFMYRVLIVE